MPPNSTLYATLFGTECSLGRHCMLLFSAPYAPLLGTVCSLVGHHMLPCLAPYAPLFGTVCSLVWHNMLSCLALYAPLFGIVCSLVPHHTLPCLVLNERQKIIPRRSPIQVLTQVNLAKFQLSNYAKAKAGQRECVCVFIPSPQREGSLF